VTTFYLDLGDLDLYDAIDLQVYYVIDLEGMA
jgi:hypothetical protein